MFTIVYYLKDKEDYLPYRSRAVTVEDVEEKLQTLNFKEIKKIFITEEIIVEKEYKFNKKTKKIEEVVKK